MSNDSAVQYVQPPTWACRFVRLPGWRICCSIFPSIAAPGLTRITQRVLAYRERYGVE